MDISEVNGRICRACLRQYDSRNELISLYQKDSVAELSFHEMLCSVLQYILPENDALPMKICILCLSNLRVSYFFRQEVEKSQKKLLNITFSSEESIKIKEEPVEERSFPIILRPRHVNKDLFNESNIQDEVLLQSDNEIIDYEPDIESVGDFNDTFNSNGSNNSNEPVVENSNEHAEDNSNFSCVDCNKDFNNLKALQCHKRIQHLVKRCKYCDKKFGNRAQLKLHTKFKHSKEYDKFLKETEPLTATSKGIPDFKEPVVYLERLEKFYDCSTCEIRFASKIALVKHHADCDNKCIDCGLKIPRKDFYFKHLEKAHKYSSIDLTGYECPFCMNLFQSETILQEHILRLHPDENQSNADTFSEADESISNDGFKLHQCKICSQQFQSSKSLKQHTTLKHKDLRDIINDNKLQITSATKYTKDEFFEKFIIKKSTDYYHCVPCQKVIYKRSLLMHIKSKHAAIRCHRCELCSDAFFRVDYRQRHFFSVHPNDYKCSKCNIQFDRAYKYDAHMTKHGQVQKIFKPDEANDKYDLSHNYIMYVEDTTIYDFTNDLQTTTVTDNVQDVEIPLTKEEFCDKYMINVSEKTTKCNICNVEMQKSSIISHLYWKHAVKKPLKCSFCNERVVKNNARLVHMSKCHPYEYRCVDCNQQFAKHYAYAEHVLYAHGKKVSSMPSSGEEEDLTQNDMRFVQNKNEDEIIEETENINIEAPPCVEKLFACQLCPKKFTSPKNLLIHKSHKHKYETTEVQEQVQDTSIEEPMTIEEFKQNWVEYISATDWKCLGCEQVLKMRSFTPHVKAKHSTTRAYLCALCPESFYRYDQRIQHMAQNHRGIFSCSTCNIQFYRNSRYAKHMYDVHAIEIDNYDSYEVDINVNDLKFLPYVKKTLEDDQISSYSSNANEPEIADPMEEMMQVLSTSEEMSRSEFLAKYIKTIGQEKHCLACNKIFNQSSIYHHLVHFHAITLPYKCPFCDVRFERSVTRAKHLHYFHPDEYKCNECGLQFQKHLMYCEHMLIEHNITVTSPKSILEENDIATSDLRYSAFKSGEDSFWQDDENGLANSTAYSDQQEYQDDDSTEPDETILSKIKTDMVEHSTISFIQDNNLIEIPPQNSSTTAIEGEIDYINFKQKYLKKIDNDTTKCLACNRILLKASIYAHLRLWHATTMIFHCELCSAGFRRGDYRMRHMASMHPNDYQCIECNTQFYYSLTYKDHLASQHDINIDVPILKNKLDIDVPLESLKFAPFIPEDLRMHNPEETSVYKATKTFCKRRLSINADKLIKGQDDNSGYTYKIFYGKYVKQMGEFSKCIPCNLKLSKMSIKKHIKKAHATKKPYNCQLCDEGFYRIDDRINHMKKNHPDSFKCLMCDIQFHLSTIYIDHMSTEHNMNLNIASNKTKDEVDISLERLRFVPKKMNEDQKNGSGNDAKNPDDGSMSREEFTDRFITRNKVNGELLLKCAPCKKVFNAKQKRFHLLHHHAKIRPFGCDLCSTRFISNSKRSKHMEVHHPNDFICEICGTQFETASRYAQHMQNLHGSTVKVNSKCDTDLNAEEMRYFEKIEKPINKQSNNTFDNTDESSSFQVETLRCEICNIDFDSSRSYRQHIRDHGGENIPIIKEEKPDIKMEATVNKIFPCDICDKVLSSVLARNAHKNFKHGSHENKQKISNQKMEIVCEICEFTSYRRDYLEHHVRSQHRPEFSCPYCKRFLSSYIHYIYHIETSHYKKLDTSKSYKCSDCDSYFQLKESLQKHKDSKHGSVAPVRNNFCQLCGMDFKYPVQYKTHLETYTHKNIVSFLNGETSQSIKGEPEDKSTILETSNSLKVSRGKETVPDTEQNNDLPTVESDEPEAKRLKMTENDSASDKLEYLKFLQKTESGNFKCGICGKVKLLRKYMLHHLKQHKEVPTFDCDKCSERFVFKNKYDKHVELHTNGTKCEPSVENEHPKFQEVKKPPSEIRCTICNTTFKLTIMLNQHNATWHSDSNPLKNLPVQEQKMKLKKNGQPGKSPIDKSNEKKCEGEKKNEEENGISCEKCFLKFHDKKFLDNHQTFFCVYRNQGSTKILNEQ